MRINKSKKNYRYEYFEKEELSVELIKNYIYSVDNDFSPKMSETINIDDWTKKIQRECFHIVCWLDELIVGISSIYCNPEKFDFAYWTLYSVKKEHRGMVGLDLYEKTISLCKNKKSKGIDGFVAEGNVKTFKIHRYNNFMVMGSTTNKNGIKGYKLRLIF